MAQKNNTTAKGLYTDPNQISSVPDGAMVKADNVVIDRPNVIESRRGFNKYGNTFGTENDRAKQVLTYKNRLLVHYNDVLLFNNNQHNNTDDGNFLTFNGSYTELESGLRIKAAESNKNLYFTTSDGIKKIVARTASDFTTSAGFIIDAGAAKALDVIGALESTGQGFLPPNSEVAYRVVWGYKDINNNLILGSPSSRLVMSNYTNSNANVDLQFSIPQNITNNYFYQIYRSAVFTAVGSLTLDDIDPGDELHLVYEDFPTTSELTAGILNIEDVASDDFRAGGAFLYTNPNAGDGIGQANEPPPKAKDLTMYQNTIFYANTVSRARTTIALLGVEALISGSSSITIDDSINPSQTYTFTGTKQKSRIDFTSYTGTIPDDLNGTYFLINSSSNKRKYYVWFDTTKTRQIVDFTNYVGIPDDLNEQFFVIYTPDPDIVYFVWYDFTGIAINPGTNTNNGLTGYIPIKVDITGTTTLTQVANLTQIAIGLNDIDNFFDMNYATGSAVGVTVTLGTPTSINSTAHGLETGDAVIISNSTTTPNIDNTYYVTKVDANNFTIDITTTVGGTADWDANDELFVLNSESFDDTFLVENENILGGFSLTIDTPENEDPSNDLGTHTDVVGRSGIKVNVSRNITTKAGVSDALAAAILDQDTAQDFVVTYDNGDEFVDIENNNNGVTDATVDSGINPIGNSISITTLNVGTGEDASANKVLLSAALSPAQQIDETARSLVNVINKNTSDSVYAYYISGPNDLPGQILFETRDIGINQFSITANNADTGGSFNPSLPPFPGASSVTGEVETKPNRIYYAKLQQPDAVPLLNFIDVGPEDKEIVRILALRESLFLLKEDGVYRLTGVNGNFAVDLFDESTKIIAPDSAVVHNNQIYCLTNLGVVTISDTGVSVISNPISSDIQLLTSSNYTFKYTSFGVSYENDNSYLLWLPKNTTDTVATFALRYSTNTNTFTTFNLSKTCGIVNSFDDKMYLGSSDTNYVERERKRFNRTDFADRDFVLNIPSDSVDGNTLTLSSTSLISAGDAVVQSQYLTIGEYNQLLKKLDLDPSIGQAEVTKFDFTSYTGSIPNDLHSKYFILYSASDLTRYVVFYDAQGDLSSLDTTVFNDISDATQIRVDISSGVTSLSDLALTTKIAIQSSTLDFIITYISLDTFFSVKTSRNGNTTDASDSSVNGLSNGFSVTVTTQGIGDFFDLLSMDQGDNVYSKLTDLATKLDNDPGVVQTDYLSSIGTYSDTGSTVTFGNPTIINSTAHGLQTGRLVTFINSTSTPSIDGDYIIEKIDNDNFSISFTTTIGGTVDWSAGLTTFAQAQAAFNTIVIKINDDAGVSHQNYIQSSGIKEYEVLILTKILNSSDVIVQFSMPLIEGSVTIYKGIKCDVQYSPETFGDPSLLKQVTESTVMFENANFSRANVEFKTDLSPGLEGVDFTKSGKGDFGFFVFNEHNWGGGFSGVPLRTYIPRQKQRCRYIQMNFVHDSSREKFALYGHSYSVRVISERAYRS